MSTHLHFPYRIDGRGLTATADRQDYIRQVIEQVLFTSSGERVNRPDFGSGLRQTVFQPASGQMTTAVQFLVQGALQQWLGDLIIVENVTVTAEDGKLSITVRFVVQRTSERETAHFEQQVPS